MFGSLSCFPGRWLFDISVCLIKTFHFSGGLSKIRGSILNASRGRKPPVLIAFQRSLFRFLTEGKRHFFPGAGSLFHRC